jgi:predicted RNA binding protein YcfA (HicA-like mRNA interferase family)
MPQLPVVSGRQARRVFEKSGWVFDRQRGSHMIPVKSGVPWNLSVPDHRELDRGLLRGLIRDAGQTVEQYIALL